MWLIEHDISIRCVRIKPWRMEDGTVLLDVQQLIPLPEASEFQTQVGVKKQAERQNRMERHGLRLKFWEGLLKHAKTRTDIHANIKPTESNWIQGSAGRAGFLFIYRVRKIDSQVELWIGLGSGKMNEGCCIRNVIEGGYRSPPEQWPTIYVALVDAMVRLEKAMRVRVADLRF